MLHKGEADAGTILVSMLENGGSARLYERMPSADGERRWQCTRQQAAVSPKPMPGDSDSYEDYLQRRIARDRDLWVIELDVADGERFIR